ncbi:hypothetical protein SAMN05660690_0031 [Geodermatophilus telluris]|uniref:DUF4439 domain-containing protein n=1 Tax=Geodermatophilus telluris TaxID=1190417 RepID=A0A1G6HUX4_9ACTN|nr:hypothetical protein [Geodermatophilus telluris]SDB97990.1 hypothetical protein SAMN05660690_0031 [Geodermatophilus telluris]
MSAPPAPLSPAGFSRRGLLAGAAGLALLAAAGCTPGGSGEAARETAAQVDRLAAQVAVQEAVVAAYAAAGDADPALRSELAVPADQARDQLDRLRAAAPSATTSAPPSAPDAVPAVAPPAGADVRGWLREQVGTAATSHATACVEAAGARAALLGSVAAGLRGHEAALA